MYGDCGRVHHDNVRNHNGNHEKPDTTIHITLIPKTQTATVQPNGVQFRHAQLRVQTG